MHQKTGERSGSRCLGGEPPYLLASELNLHRSITARPVPASRTRPVLHAALDGGQACALTQTRRIKLVQRGVRQLQRESQPDSS